MPDVMSTIRELHDAQTRAWKGWRSRPNGWDVGQAATRAFREAGEILRQRLPFRTSIAYAYSPRENVGSGGGDHIVCAENVTAGRLKRQAGDALCKPQARFWGLQQRWGADTCLNYQATASCLRCLEIAEKLSEARTHETP